jgi:hypothetical protein
MVKSLWGVSSCRAAVEKEVFSKKHLEQTGQLIAMP